MRQKYNIYDKKWQITLGNLRVHYIILEIYMYIQGK
jgi:hypothetical protein